MCPKNRGGHALPKQQSAKENKRNHVQRIVRRFRLALIVPHDHQRQQKGRHLNTRCIARLAIEDQVRKDPIIQESRAKIANEGHPAIIDLKHRHESASDGEEKAKQVNEFDFGGGSNGVENKNDGDRVIALVFVDIEFELHLHGWVIKKSLSGHGGAEGVDYDDDGEDESGDHDNETARGAIDVERNENEDEGGEAKSELT